MNPPNASTTAAMTMRVFGRMSGNRDDRPTDNEAGLVAVSIAARDGQPDLLRQYSDRRDRFVGESSVVRPVHGKDAEQLRAGEDRCADADAKTKQFGELSEIEPRIGVANRTAVDRHPSRHAAAH